MTSQSGGMWGEPCAEAPPLIHTAVSHAGVTHIETALCCSIQPEHVTRECVLRSPPDNLVRATSEKSLQHHVGLEYVYKHQSSCSLHRHPFSSSVLFPSAQFSFQSALFMWLFDEWYRGKHLNQIKTTKTNMPLSPQYACTTLTNLVRPRRLSVNIFSFLCIVSLLVILLWTDLNPSVPISLLSPPPVLLPPPLPPVPPHLPSSSLLSSLLSASFIHLHFSSLCITPLSLPPPPTPPLPSFLPRTRELTLGKEARAWGDPGWNRGSGSRGMGLESERKRGQSRWETLNEPCVCVRERERERERGRSGRGIEIVSTLTLQEHSLDPLRAAPWRMTKAVFALPHSFSWMFSADKVFVSKTKPRWDKAPAKVITGLCLSLSFLYLCFPLPASYSLSGR